MFWRAGLPPRMVAVPTHFFKVVLAERASGGAEGDQQVALGAFVLPNAPVQPDTPLTAFSVPVESLEEAAGGVTQSPSSERPCSGTYPLHLDAVMRHVHLMPPQSAKNASAAIASIMSGC